MISDIPKIYGILSARKGTSEFFLSSNVLINVLPAQNLEAAIEQIKTAMKEYPLTNPDEYDVGLKHVEIAMPILQIPSPSVTHQKPLPPTPEERREKSVEELSAYVRYVFSAMSDEDKEAAERAITSFTNNQLTKNA